MPKQSIKKQESKPVLASTTAKAAGRTEPKKVSRQAASPAAPAKPVSSAAKRVPAGKPRVSAAKHRVAPSTAVIAPAAPETAHIVDNSREIIASIAYGYWEARGRQGGDPFEDWVRAEREYKARTAVAAL